MPGLRRHEVAVSNRDRLPGEAGGEPREAWGGREAHCSSAPAIQILSPMVGKRKTFTRRTDQIVKQMGELKLHSGKGLDERGINSSPNLCPPREEKLQNKECPGLRSTRYPHLTLSNCQPD